MNARLYANDRFLSAHISSKHLKSSSINSTCTVKLEINKMYKVAQNIVPLADNTPINEKKKLAVKYPDSVDWSINTISIGRSDINSLFTK